MVKVIPETIRDFLIFKTISKEYFISLVELKVT